MGQPIAVVGFQYLIQPPCIEVAPMSAIITPPTGSLTEKIDNKGVFAGQVQLMWSLVSTGATPGALQWPPVPPFVTPLWNMVPVIVTIQPNPAMMVKFSQGPAICMNDKNLVPMMVNTIGMIPTPSGAPAPSPGPPQPLTVTIINAGQVGVTAQ